jgi:acyl-CoA synthetase (AMP-forming)/AMP-acid ligase II
MHTTPQARIDELTARGDWGNDTLHDLLAQQVARNPQRLAVADQPNRAAAALPQTPVLAFGRELTIDAPDESSRQRLIEYRQTANDDANRIITVCWTSGTTGTPKGVPRSHNMWMATARPSADAGDYREGEILLNPFPLVNMAALGGFLYASAMLGCSLVLHHPLDPTLFLQQMQDEKINFTIAPPALLNQLAKNPDLWGQFDFSALRAVGSGSAPLSPDMIDTLENKYGKPVINYYGSNEGISLFSTPSCAAEPEVRASMFPRYGVEGMPFDCITQKIVRSKVIDPDTGEDITEPGRPGELCFGGATVFDGYLGTAGEPPTLEALCEFLLQRGIARFKLPERTEVMTALPRNPMNKIVRTALQDAIS